MEPDLVADVCTDSGRQALEIDDSLRRENDLMTHSSQMIARIAFSSTPIAFRNLDGAVSSYGTTDMAGNVKEWCWNEIA